MSEENMSKEVPAIKPARPPAKPTPAPPTPPSSEFTLPSMDQIWPLVMQTYSQVLTGARGLLPESSPQVQSDWALGTAVLTMCNIYISTEPATTLGYQATILSNFTVNNVKNIGSLVPSPPIGNDAGVQQWIQQQIPNLSAAQLFQSSPNGVADYLLWGMACREMLIYNKWDVSGITESTVQPEKPTLYVSGRFLYDRHGNKVVLRGVDYQALDNYNYPGVDYLDQVQQTGANAIRIPWYDVYPDSSRPAYSIDNLTNLIDRCVAANVIPIVEFAQYTSYDDMSLLSSEIVPWWTSAGDHAGNGVLAALTARQSCLIINIANELGTYRWTNGDMNTALTTYSTAYEAAIKAMRAAGYTCPLMIDAPDAGTTLNAFLTNGTGAALLAADPLPMANVLLSSHCYWAAYSDEGNVAAAVAANLPIVFAEVANKEGDPPDNLPIYDLDGTHEYTATTTGYTYQEFLGKTLLSNQIGWLAWSWFQDDVVERNMSSDGSFASLTAYGLDITNNMTYGLKATAVKIVP